LYYGLLFLRLIIKGGTFLIIALFVIKKSALNFKVILTIIFLFINKETIEIISSWIPFDLKTLFSKSWVRKNEKKKACTLCASKRVYLLEKASLSLFASLELELVLILILALLLCLFLSLVTSVQFYTFELFEFTFEF
jgi:hypothetical protein